ncbi:MAG: type I DNA topoisomerase [Peptostreptococcaceae bacterium]|nr:type I DNA topoisomerase [Peptostreptococcaceae bacterium]
MSKKLVVVESPAKAKTIEKFLGKKTYTVKASVGHVRDLPKSKLGVDIENDFEPQYITIRGKGDVVAELKKEAKKADMVYLATDPDREGEAISWHLANLLNLPPEKIERIEFNEITKTAVNNAIKNPRKINMDIVDAQQARRVIDRLVGYKISPILWSKVQKGLSAGRVQSVATKIIRDREKEIKDFVPEEFWNLELDVIGDDKKTSRFKYHGKQKKAELKNKEQTDRLISEIKGKKIKIVSIEEKERRRSSPKPFTTSQLQQESGTKLSFATKKTMMIAQQLYEGVDIKGKGTVGLITYIRTDSQRISDEALAASKRFIVENYGERYYKKYIHMNKKGKKIQDAHECIRPTYVEYTPESIKDSLSPDQYKLYKLVWERFIACSMADAVFDVQNIDGQIEEHIFKTSGNKLKFDGFLRTYSFAKAEEVAIPQFTQGMEYQVKKIDPSQHFTQPPARYTEATLVKTLEEKGIGRPSTYAPTISTIISRGYISKKSNALYLTELGDVVTNIMENNFSKFVDIDFTADMENGLDMIEEGEERWKDFIAKFYPPLHEAVKIAEEQLEKIEAVVIETEEVCDLCGSNMVIRNGRYGQFLACKNYPECKNTKPIFEKVGVKCPQCEDGEVIVKKSKRGKVFYGCSNFPRCRFATWSKPLDKNCSKCGSIMVEKVGKTGTVELCSNTNCENSKTKNKG